MITQNRGRFIVIDGPDGAGKGEQIRRLKTNLTELYPERTFVFTREPGGSPYAEDIRRLIFAEEGRKASGATLAQLFGAARFDHIEKVILPQLEMGAVVITDRFDASTYAYQIVAQVGGEGATQFFMLQRKLIEQAIGSWMTIILDVDAQTAMQRAANRTGQERTHFDERKEAFHEMVRHGYESYARQYSNVSIVDTCRSIDEVHKDVLSLLQGVL